MMFNYLEPELSSPEQDPIQLEPIVSEKKRRRPESTESEDVTIVPGEFLSQKTYELELKCLLIGSLHVKGEIVAKAFMQFSDERLKTNIVDLVDALQIVTSLQGKSYQWKADTGQPNEGGKRVIGLIAQEVQKVLPEVSIVIEISSQLECRSCTQILRQAIYPLVMLRYCLCSLKLSNNF